MSWKARFKEGLEFLKSKKHGCAVLSFHMSGEQATKAYLGLKPENRLYFLEGIRRLHTKGVISRNTLKKLENFNLLRNRVYHEGYEPSEKEVHLGKEVIKKFLSALKVCRND